MIYIYTCILHMHIHRQKQKSYQDFVYVSPDTKPLCPKKHSAPISFGSEDPLVAVFVASENFTVCCGDWLMKIPWI